MEGKHDVSVTIDHAAYNDDTDMARLGKSQVFTRNFRFLSTLGFVSVFVSTWLFVLVATSSGLINGGFGGLIYEYIWTFLAYSTIVLSMAEMSSMSPTAGGQYHWVSEFAPTRWQKLLSYLSGWTSVIAWQPALAGGLYPAAVMIESLVQIHTPSFVMTRWQVSLLMIAMGILTVPYNTIWRKSLPAFETIVLILYFTGFVITLIILWILGPKNSPNDVFAITNLGGWSSTPLSLLIGQVSVFYCMAGFDSAVHLAEEVSSAALTVPRSMFYAFLLNSLMGFAMLLTMCFCLGTLEEALDVSQPFVRVFSNTGSPGAATALTVVLLVLMVAGNNTCTTTSSRMLWAFARDRGMPFSEWLGRIHESWNVPLNAIIVTCGVNVVLCLINLGSDFAFSIIISIQSVGFLATYIISIACLIHARLTRPCLPSARWSLGRFGLPINIFAVAYASFLLVFAFFPIEIPVTPGNMNWACVVLAGVLGVAGVFYGVWGRGVYVGPVVFVKGGNGEKMEGKGREQRVSGEDGGGEEVSGRIA